MDVSDRGTQQEAFLLQSALNEQALKPRLQETGQCLNCDEPIGVGMFCDAYCRDDFEWRTSRLAANGEGLCKSN